MNEDAGETVQSEAEYAKLFNEAYRKITCPTCGGVQMQPIGELRTGHPLRPNQKISGM